MKNNQMGTKMKNSFESHWWLPFVSALIVIALGCWMFFGTGGFMKVAVIVMGIAGVVTGATTLVSISQFPFQTYNKGATIFKGIVNIVVGFTVVILAIIMDKAKVLSVLTIILGIQLTISSIVAFWDAYSLRKSGFSMSGLVLEAVLSLVFALLMFLFPSTVGAVIVKVVGVVVFLVGVGAIVWAFRIRSATKALHEAMNTVNIPGEAEVIDDEKKK